jgi:murein L,D-transpeptidase YcbB/YkuD
MLQNMAKYEVPAQAEGTVRDFIYSTFDYHKPYAYGLGGTIGPLPFNEMTQYPYRESEENYPYEANQSYINEYNTRIINWTGLSSDIIPNQIHHSLNTDYINVEVTEGTGTTTRSHITSSGSSAQAIAQFKAEQLQLVTPVVEPTPEPTTNLTPLNLSRTLRLNMTGDDVKALQTYLNTAGFNCGIVDGKFGPKTKAGVILFQKANGLVPDGIVGPLTMAKMK